MPEGHPYLISIWRTSPKLGDGFGGDTAFINSGYFAKVQDGLTFNEGWVKFILEARLEVGSQTVNELKADTLS